METDKTPEELFQERQKRVNDAIELKTPDRVPLEIAFSYFPGKYCGLTSEAAYYDYDSWLAACKKTIMDFGADISSVQPFFPGAILELLDPKTLKWPGHDNTPLHSHQVLDGEYMRATEYDDLLGDPTDFMLRCYLPRVSGAMEGFSSIGALPLPDQGYRGALSLAEAFSSPDVEGVLQRLLKIGKELREWRPKMMAFHREIEELGFPPFVSGANLAPYDVIADNLRGMQGCMLDMYRQPDKLLEACDAILGRIIARMKPAVEGELNNVSIPLHFGSEGFCSIKQFETFYWPTLKGLILALIDKGYTPLVFTEGDYTSRLEYLLELPKGKVFLHFDSTDLFKAKEILGGHLCISGNVPCSLLQTGTMDDVREHARKLIDVCGKDGGYIMSTRSPVDDARPENLKALIDFTIEYGVYA